MKPWMGSLAVKRMAAVTAKLAAKDGVVMAKPPNIAVNTRVIRGQTGVLIDPNNIS